MKTVLGIYPPQCAQTPQDTAGPSSSDGGSRTTRTISLSGRCLSRN